jgi:hypothetical protein
VIAASGPDRSLLIGRDCGHLPLPVIPPEGPGTSPGAAALAIATKGMCNNCNEQHVLSAVQKLSPSSRRVRSSKCYVMMTAI